MTSPLQQSLTASEVSQIYESEKVVVTPEFLQSATTHPVDTNGTEGGSVTFSVTATGSLPP